MNKNIDFFIKKYLENRPAFMALIRSQEAHLFQKFKKYLKKKILDFGCGDGFFAKVTFGRNFIDIGLDIKNERTLKIVNKKIYKKVVIYDGKKIPFKDNFFQTVVSNCVLEHLPKLNQSLKEISRVLKKNGYFLTTVMTDKWSQFMLGKKVFGNSYVSLMNKKQKHFNLLTASQWQKVFEKNGFSVIEKIGYLSKRNSQFLDLFHYFSTPSLFTYKIFGRWVIYPSWYKFLKIDKFIKKQISFPPPKNSAAVFFVLKKINL